ncbi:hypothetical protein B5C34_03180 [Pacificimonas flava]|uniref:Uncharacterized protein n=2 Tax=Pacificimonas TaxID=1960290 RepID=A0A219B2F9_9SPHN|nr:MULTISPECIES: hypothetical protein [Pacificimonas]MBZ6377778.1 hypothetical protein [Pacificimonas aurantium]OWV32547.1 hypothetical protein B5C34_03180 [Pacificimonas flava]
MGNGGRTILWIAILAVVVLIILYALGFFSAEVEGELEAPNVDVSAEGGSIPDVDVDAGEIEVGTEEEVVEVPTIDVEEAGEPDEE